MFMRVPFAMLAVAVVCSTHALAADNIRYVSTTGANANACTLAAPCRTFQRGINTTPTGGELRILDSGDYGVNANVNRSMTISANGHTVILGNPITINGDAVVALRGLVLNGQGTTQSGIVILTAIAVHIERCVIHDFFGIGINSNSSELFVIDTIARDNNNSGLVATAAGLTIDNSHFQNNRLDGVLVGNGSGHATINRSTASGNGSNGIRVVDGSIITVNATMAVQNAFAGLRLLTGTTARISNSTFTGNNSKGIDNAGTVRTLGNNVVDGNTNDVVGGTVQAVTPF